MKHATSIVLALFGLAAAAPAQFRFEGIFGHQVRLGVQVGHREPVRTVPVVDHGHGRGFDRDFHGHGRWETVSEQVHVPGYWTEECVPARYGWVRDHCGRRVWGIVAPACTQRVWVPPHCETRSRRVWVRC